MDIRIKENIDIFKLEDAIETLKKEAIGINSIELFRILIAKIIVDKKLDNRKLRIRLIDILAKEGYFFNNFTIREFYLIFSYIEIEQMRQMYSFYSDSDSDINFERLIKMLVNKYKLSGNEVVELRNYNTYLQELKNRKRKN